MTSPAAIIPDKRILKIFLICLIILFLSPLAGNAVWGSNPVTVDIGLFTAGCGDFVIKARPSDDLTGTSVTNLQFTLRWPANTVNLLNFSSDYAITRQGPVYQSAGFNYAVYAMATAVPINWVSGNEYSLLSFSHDHSGTANADFSIAGDAWTLSNNGTYYFELLGLDETGSVYHQAANTWLGSCGKVDAGLFNTSCGNFELRLKPHADFPANTLTNIQFTLSWPANTVNLLNFSTAYDIQQQGPVQQANGFNYAVFVSASSIPVNWTAETEYTVLSFSHDHSGNGYAEFSVDESAWSAANNGTYYLEFLGQDYTGLVYQDAQNCYLGSCGKVEVKVLLQGPWDASAGLMSNSLSISGNLPLVQTFAMAPWNYPGTEHLSSFPDYIVDWVLVELHDKTNPALTVERKAGLLSRNGDILDTDLSSGLSFTSLVNPSDYYIVIRHRNHMPVMSGLPVSLPNPGQPYDFTGLSLTQPYLHNNPLPAELELDPPGSGIYGMIAGDVNSDNRLMYLGLNNDRAPILSRILDVSGQSSLNAFITGYYKEDITLDNKVIYLGTANDRGLILSNLLRLTGSSDLNAVYYSLVP